MTLEGGLNSLAEKEGLRFKIKTTTGKTYFVYAKDQLEAGQKFKENPPEGAKAEGEPLIFEVELDTEKWETKLQDGRSVFG